MGTAQKKENRRSRVLVADISNTVRMLIRKYLDKNYDVVEATSGSEIFSIVDKYHSCDSCCVREGGMEAMPRHGSSACDEKDLSLVILCMEFPDYTAFQISEKLRKKCHKKCLPILLNTSSNKRDVITEALECGINDFIVKPFPPELLLSKIRKLERDIPIRDQEMSEMIARIPFFRGVPDSQVAYLLNTCSRMVEKETGDTVCIQNEKNFDLYILMEGKCNVLYNEKKVAEIKPIDTIGEMGFIGERPRSATVVAALPSKIIVLDKARFDDYLNEERAISETICKNIIFSLNERIKKSNDLVKKLKIMAEEYLSY